MIIDTHQFSPDQSLSRVWLLVTPWIAAHWASLSITNSQSLLKLVSIELVMPFNHLIICCPLLLQPSVFPNIRVFSNESILFIRWPKYWSFSFNIILPMNMQDLFPLGLIGLISSQSKGLSRDWFDLLTVQGTLKSLLKHHYSKASILQHSAFFLVQLSHPYMTTGKTIDLTKWTFVSKVISLFPLFPHLFAMKWWDQMPLSSFFECWVLSTWLLEK